MTQKKSESAKGPKVVGKINLDTLNEKTRPKKRSKEEKAALRQQMKEEQQQYNANLAAASLQKDLAVVNERIAELEQRADALRTRLNNGLEENKALDKERKDLEEQLVTLERKADMRKKYAANPDMPNGVRQKELHFNGIRPKKMDVVHFEIPKSGDREKTDGVALAFDENHYHLAVDMYDHPEREENYTTLMDENPDGTFDGIWPQGVVLRMALGFEERFMRNLAERYRDDLVKAERFIAVIAENERNEMEEIKAKLASLNERLAGRDADIRELGENSEELMHLRIKCYKMEQGIKKILGDEPEPEAEPKTEPEKHLEEDYEPMEPIDSDSDIEQRGEFVDPVTLKAADNTEFSARPTYSYKVIKSRAIDIVFDNKHIDKAETENGKDGFMQSLEDNILEPRIYDLIKEESRKHKTDSLMADGGSLLFEKKLEDIVEKEFEKRGLHLLSFSAQLEFSSKVREKIDSRNEVNTNISVLDQQIEEQKKRNQLEELKTQQALIKSRGLTKEILYQKFIDKWDGKTPIYGAIPELIKVQR